MNNHTVSFSSYTKSTITWPPNNNNFIILSDDYHKHITNNPPAFFYNNFWHVNFNSNIKLFKNRTLRDYIWLYYN